MGDKTIRDMVYEDVHLVASALRVIARNLPSDQESRLLEASELLLEMRRCIDAIVMTGERKLSHLPYSMLISDEELGQVFGVPATTIHKWTKSHYYDFPQPTYFKGKVYPTRWRVGDVQDYLRKHKAK